MTSAKSNQVAPELAAERRLWKEQWEHFATDPLVERAMLERWIAPLSLGDLAGKEILDCGCGNGLHAMIMVQAGARSVHGVDYASWEGAAHRFKDQPALSFAFHDLCGDTPLPGQYDVVTCVGVLPHVPSPEVAVSNIARAVKPGGRLLIWATVREGNTPLLVFDTVKTAVTSWGGRRIKTLLATEMALASLPFQYAARVDSIRDRLPYGRYLAEISRFPFSRVVQNFYDALNVPRRILFTTAEARQWMEAAGLEVLVHPGADGKSCTWHGVRPL